MTSITPTYYLGVEFGGEKFERKVSVEEYCKAERAAGFRPKMESSHPLYMKTPATGGFGGGAGISGHIKYNQPEAQQPVETSQPDPAAHAIQFALNTEDGLKFLRRWNEGDFDVIREEWPEAPDGVFIGADTLFKLKTNS